MNVFKKWGGRSAAKEKTVKELRIKFKRSHQDE